MRLTDDLFAEHALIEQVLGSMRCYLDRLDKGEADVRDGVRFVRFLRTYVGGYHHEREESVLFPALTRDAGLPSGRGPVAALVEQHHDLAHTLDALVPWLSFAPRTPDERAAVATLATKYTHGLWQHIDAENSVLIPECPKRLARAGITELPMRAPTESETEARIDGERLVMEYPPLHDPRAMRGEGCVICPSFGKICDGVEREWWNEFEWEEFGDRLG